MMNIFLRCVNVVSRSEMMEEEQPPSPTLLSRILVQDPRIQKQKQRINLNQLPVQVFLDL